MAGLPRERGRTKKRFQYCLDSNGYFCTCVLFKATLEGAKLIHLCRKDSVKIPDNKIEYIYHAGSSHDCHSVIQPGLIAGGKDTKQRRQTVFFTASGYQE